MFVNKLNQLYKPERILLYRFAESGEIQKILEGKGMPDLEKYKNTFGTYDAPGIFFIDSFEEPVIGIEYRMNDPRIDYPLGLRSIVLKESFFLKQ